MNKINTSLDEIHLMLTRAYLKARENERNAATQLEFEYYLEENLHKMAYQIYKRCYIVDPPICFIIEEPLKREVFAPSFRDRVVSHVLFDLIEPVFEKTFIYDTYSCRKGKGTHFGEKRFTHMLRSCTDNYKCDAYVLNIDISGYFMNINKSILYNIICKRLEKEKRTGTKMDYGLVDYLIRIVLFKSSVYDCVKIGKLSDWDGLPKNKSLFNSPMGVGLTIGDIMSQLFSNIYLSIFDNYCKRVLKCKYYCRYVDDIRVISRDKERLKVILEEIRTYLHNKNELTVHPYKTTITNTKYNVLFLGGCFRKHRVYMKSKSLRRVRKHLKENSEIMLSEESGPKEKERAINNIKTIVHTSARYSLPKSDKYFEEYKYL